MKRITKLFVVMMAFCLMIAGTVIIVPDSHAQPLTYDSDIQSEFIDKYIESVQDTLNAPTCTVYTSQKFGKDDILLSGNCLLNSDTVYNCAVVYKWQVGAGGTQLSLSTTGSVYHTFGPIYYDIVVPALIGDKSCQANYCYGMSINGENSSGTTTIAWEHYNEEKDYYQVKYEYDCKYVCVGRINPALAPYVPTKYDENYFVWEHGGKNKNIIKGTIVYNNEVSDIEVTIPLIGYASSEITLDGVTFYLRTGPNKCSIKASESVIAKFAFGVA